MDWKNALTTEPGTAPIEEFLRSARAAGLHLMECGRSTCPLYVWVGEDGRGAVTYIGLAESRSRIPNENRWIAVNPYQELAVGFIRLIRRTKSVQRTFNYRFDREVASELLSRFERDGWSGPAFDKLRDWLDGEQNFDAKQAEYLLIRLAVAAGMPIGNSRHAGMWEGDLGKPVDTLAQMAVIETAGAISSDMSIPHSG